MSDALSPRLWIIAQLAVAQNLSLAHLWQWYAEQSQLPAPRSPEVCKSYVAALIQEGFLAGDGDGQGGIAGLRLTPKGEQVMRGRIEV